MLMGPILVSAASAVHHDYGQNDPKGVRIQVFLNFCSILSGSGSQMLMAPTPLLAVWAGQDHDPNVPKGVRVQVFF